MNPKFVGNALTDGTRFIKYENGGDTFIIETKNKGIFSVGIHSENIDAYYNLLGRGKDQVDRRILPRLYGNGPRSTGRPTVGEIDPQHHRAAHDAGLNEGPKHSHWGGLGDNPDADGMNAADGYMVLALLASKLGSKAMWDIVTLARS
jgi:hypothetical protein